MSCKNCRKSRPANISIDIELARKIAKLAVDAHKDNNEIKHLAYSSGQVINSVILRGIEELIKKYGAISKEHESELINLILERVDRLFQNKY